VLPFAIATTALLLVAFFSQVRRPWLATSYVALSPLVAGLSIASGLLIGPVTICLAIMRRLPYRFVIVILTVFVLSIGIYVWGYKSPDPANSAQSALADPKGLFVYVLTYFGARLDEGPSTQRTDNSIIFDRLLRCSGNPFDAQTKTLVRFRVVLYRRMQPDARCCVGDRGRPPEVRRRSSLCESLPDSCNAVLGCALFTDNHRSVASSAAKIRISARDIAFDHVPVGPDVFEDLERSCNPRGLPPTSLRQRHQRELRRGNDKNSRRPRPRYTARRDALEKDVGRDA
jgi:hypothetical protein